MGEVNVYPYFAFSLASVLLMSVWTHLKNKIFWEPLKITSYFIYFLIVIFLLFKPRWSVILIFFLIALWSRVPCMMGHIKEIDMIDFFAVLIAINIGGIKAAFFVIAVMLVSRLFGPGEEIMYTFIDTIEQSLSAIFIPLVFKITLNPLVTLYSFTIMRYVFYYATAWIIDTEFFKIQLPYLITGPPLAYLVNKFMMRFLGPIFDSTLKSGVNFNLLIFLFVTAVIICIYYFSKYYNVNRETNIEIT